MESNTKITATNVSGNELHKLIDELLAKGVDFQVVINVAGNSKPAGLTEAKKEQSPYEEITSFLHAIGMPAHIKGYQYMRDAILIGIEDIGALNSVGKILYPRIAEKHNTTPSKVERAMRHSIEVCWSKGNFEKLNEILGYNVNSCKGRPTNSEFIALIVDKFRVKYSNN